MKLEILILGITAFAIFNAYHDGYYSKMYSKNKKYIQMATWGFIGLSLYLMIKRNPTNCKNMLVHANNLIKYMPVDKNSIDMISPIFDFTGTGNGNDSSNFMKDYQNQNISINNQYERKILQSGGANNLKKTKRAVSETKKKYVASQQNWKCGECKKQLNAWFEVDHKIRLEHGGGNNVENLVALCRECHGQKTAMENM